MKDQFDNPLYLNHDNIARSVNGIEYHPLHPFLPKNCRVLFLGSFPPQRKRWCMDFFYPNFINDHWRIEGLIFFGDKDYFVDTKAKSFRLERIIPFLEQKGIGFYDTATAVRRLKDNASDKFLDIVEPTDIRSLLVQVPKCRVIVTTGEKATQTICSSLGMTQMPTVGKYEAIPGLCDIQLSVGAPSESQIYLYRLPSSSRAYPMSLEKKAEAYRQMFLFCGVE